jgi:hypothetical protein
MDERAQRLVENELKFRSINDEIETLAEDLGAEGPDEPRVWDFLCECHDAACRTHVPMTLREYEGVRADARRFVVAPSAEHVRPALEEVVDRGSRYWVVEKTGEAGERAADDPS